MLAHLPGRSGLVMPTIFGGLGTPASSGKGGREITYLVTRHISPGLCAPRGVTQRARCGRNFFGCAMAVQVRVDLRQARFTVATIDQQGFDLVGKLVIAVAAAQFARLPSPVVFFVLHDGC